MAEVAQPVEAPQKPYITIDPVDDKHGILILSNMDVYQQLALLTISAQMLATRIMQSTIKSPALVKPNGFARRIFGR